MIALAIYLVVLVSFGLLAACGPAVKEAAPGGPRTDQTQQAPPAPAPSSTTPSPAPPTVPRTQSAPAPPVASPPAPAPQEASPKPLAEAPQRLIIKVGKANLREKPDNKSRILQVLSKGAKLAAIDKGNQWYRVRLDSGAEGWVAESVVAPAQHD